MKSKFVNHCVLLFLFFSCSAFSLEFSKNNISDFFIKHNEIELIDNKCKLFLEKFIKNYHVKNNLGLEIPKKSGWFWPPNEICISDSGTKSQFEQNNLAHQPKFRSDTENGSVNSQGEILFNFSTNYIDCQNGSTLYFIDTWLPNTTEKTYYIYLEYNPSSQK